jgi:sulfatase maturation enzyme AslB (radical SAM superfamily)
MMSLDLHLPPKRRVCLSIELGADGWEDAAWALQQIAERICMYGPITDLCSGGCAVGYTVRGTEDENQTAEQYREQLKAWTAQHKARRKTEGAD